MKHIKTFVQLFESELIEESKASDLKSIIKKYKINYEKFFQSLDDILSDKLDDDMVAIIMDYLTDDGEMSKEVKDNKKLIDSSIKRLLDDMKLVKESSIILEYAEGDTLKHKHSKGLTIKLLSPTNNGWKVEQTELYKGYNDKKLPKPKVKNASYSNADLKDLFE